MCIYDELIIFQVYGFSKYKYLIKNFHIKFIKFVNDFFKDKQNKKNNLLYID